MIVYDVGVGCFKVRWHREYGRTLTITPASDGKVEVVGTEKGFEARCTNWPPAMYRLYIPGCQPGVVCPL